MAGKNKRLQIPISESKKELLDSRATQSGFDSSTDLIQFLINNFIQGSINVYIDNLPTMTLDKKTEKEVLESLKDLAEGRTIQLDPSDPDFSKKLCEFADE